MDRRCLWLLGLLLASMPASPAVARAQLVRLVIDTAYYRVEGHGPGDWDTSMDAGALASGIRPPGVGNTRSQTRWARGPLVPTASGCVAGPMDVEVVIHYTMPHLVPAPDASPDDVREWKRFLAWLWHHEEGHATRALRQGVEMRDSLNWMRAPTCAELSLNLQAAVGSVSAKYRALDAAYDARTKDRQRHGVRLPRTGLRIEPTNRDTLP